VPSASSDSITVRCTHHGYPLGKPDMEYYIPLRLGDGICSSYGRGNGKVNAGYEDIRDCYMTYLLLRDLQVIRYCTDAALSGELAEMHEKWNGKIVVEGGSMGGYQTVCIGALTTVLREKIRVPLDVIRLSASIPAFCNLAGRLDRRVPTSLTSYEEGMEYYDPVHFAPMLDAPLTVPRAALGDETCPLFGIVAMFNSVPAGTPKEINFLQNSSHGYIPDADVQQWYRYKEE